jgi:extracellular elastinolytic metalloproteinase
MKNNAMFATPPDGQSGRMNLYTWRYPKPNRESALDSKIIIHGKENNLY